MGRSCFPKGRPDGHVPQHLLRADNFVEMFGGDPELDEGANEVDSSLLRLDRAVAHGEIQVYQCELRVDWREPHHHAGRKQSGKERRQWRHATARKLSCAREYVNGL